ncbi:MAG: hypothetical protein ACRDT0_01010 [Pseudonocardiaceae bacterium]
MNVRQAIEQLTAAAESLPTGLDSPVRVALCDGVDVQVSDEVDIDHYTEVSPDVGVLGVFVMVRGHPHRDKDAGRSTKLRGWADQADEQLQRWARGEE